MATISRKSSQNSTGTLSRQPSNDGTLKSRKSSDTLGRQSSSENVVCRLTFSHKSLISTSTPLARAAP